MGLHYVAKEHHTPVCRPGLSPGVSSKRSFSDCSLDSDAHCVKRRSFYRCNLLGNRKSSADSSLFDSAVLPFKEDNEAEYGIWDENINYRCKSQDSSELLYSQMSNSNDYTTLASSVDSCGDIKCDEDMEALTSDADSSSCLSKDGRRCNLPWRAGVCMEARTFHRSELKSYRRTLEELYACGPLSWEQQGYLSDLRSMLHISNNEHLRELLAQLLKLMCGEITQLRCTGGYRRTKM